MKLINTWFLGMFWSIGRRSVSADNHILWLNRYSLYLADLMTRSQFDDVKAWGRTWCSGDINDLAPQSCHRRCGNAMMSRETMKKSLFVMYVLHDDMMNGWLIFNSRFSDVRADLRISACVCSARYGSTGTGADRSRSSQCLSLYQPRRGHVSEAALRAAFVSWHRVEDGTKPRRSRKG